ncbi:hypothetical protein FA13DRAFT_1746843 [Coprinellus micaceus]|uniref:Uncharacterized protein n=1 Tax=Coprinellus micaceus TaxID=71717 RepID=A0A4Y7S7L6_COPMI|nr:hypothetical protein FA13DRAFT_1746843 [Coprinellus micaceus]
MSLASTKPYRPPNVPEAFYENLKYGFVGVQISLFFYGIAAVLFILCFTSHIQSFQSSSTHSFSGFMAAFKSASRSKKLQLGYISALFACGTIVIVADTWANVVVTLDYPLYPGGSYFWAVTHFSDPMFMLGQVPFQVTTWLADGFMLYRCYVVYTMTAGIWFILLIPGLLYSCIHWRVPELIMVQNNLPMIVSMRKTMGTDADSMRMYTSVWTILVESSALYGVFSLWFIVTYAIDHPLSKMLLPILGQVQVIAPLLVALRLSRKMAWTTKTSRSGVVCPVSTVQFNDPGRQNRSLGIETHLSFAPGGQTGTSGSGAESSEEVPSEKAQV